MYKSDTNRIVRLMTNAFKKWDEGHRNKPLKYLLGSVDESRDGDGASEPFDDDGYVFTESVEAVPLDGVGTHDDKTRRSGPDGNCSQLDRVSE